MTESEKRAAIDALYATLPTMNCVGKCSECCGPIGMSRAEKERITQRLRGKIPSLGRDLCCPMLKNGRCSVYDIRPAICRIWGMVPPMICEFGCKPTRWLTEREGHEFLAAVERISNA